MLRVVLNTNVLVSAIISDGKPRELFRKGIEGEFSIVTSDLLLKELTRVLRRPKFKTSPSEIRRVIIHEGRETAKLRAALMKKDFRIVPVDDQIAQISAELRHKHKLSMGDSMIAATASMLNAACVSDDPHFQQIKEIKTAWI